jgi:integrase
MAKTFTKLTRPAMRRLGAGEKLNEHGITFERQTRGDGVFTVNFMVDGERIHRVIGRESDGTTRTQAEEYIEKARQDAKAGRLNLPRGRKLALGFREAAHKYLAKLAQEGGKDLPMKRYRLDHHLVRFFGDTPLSKITTVDVERYKKKRSTEPTMRPNGLGGKPVYGGPTKPATINRELAALSHLLNKAVEWGWLDHRQATIKRLQESSGRITYLTVSQIDRLLEAAQGDQSRQIYPFIRIGLDTSMRKNEILGIRREHIDTQRLVIYIPKAKAGAREQPITRSLAEYLGSYMATLQPGVQWLFPSPAAKEGRTVNLDKPFRRCVIAADLDVKQVVRHTLRHTAITHLVQAGVDLPTVKRISGHKNLSMVERYSHQNGAHIQSAMDKLQERYKNRDTGAS